MRTCENRVRDLVKAEDPVDYTVTAKYIPGQVIPASITMTPRAARAPRRAGTRSNYGPQPGPTEIDMLCSTSSPGSTRMAR